MSTELITAASAERIERIKTYHASCQRAGGDILAYWALTGLELLALKEETPHGEFEDLKKREFGDIPRACLGRYMQFAGDLKVKYPTVGYLVADRCLLTNGELSGEQRETVLQAVHEVADGKTVTAFFRELRMMRQPKKQQYHRPGQVDAQKQAAHEAKLARDHILTLAHDLGLAREELHLVDDATRDALFDACLEITTFVRVAKQSGGRKTKCK
ncbi:MAG TPA: hypothetical protein VN496_00520 [Burkholderiales bacterium]|nr:hypothetical protein [Burkholderiales bacterium]